MRLANTQPSAQPAIKLLASQAIHVEDSPAVSPDPSCRARAGKSTLAFQLGFAAADNTLDIALVHFKTRQPLMDEFLFEPLDPGQVCGNVEMTAYSMRLMDQIYAPFRDVFHTARQKQDPVLVMSLEEVVDVARP